MNEAVTRWTRLPLAFRYGTRRDYSYDPQLPVCFRGHNLTIPANFPGVEEVEVSCFTKEVTTTGIKRCIERQRDAEIGITSIKKQAIEQIDWSRVVNGVIYIFPRANLFESSNYYEVHYEHDDVAVHVYPLPLLAALARAQITTSRYNGRDMRAFYQYGSIAHNNEVWKHAVRARGRGAPKIDQMFPRRTIVVYQGKVLHHSDYCMKHCPRRVEWGLGICGFMSYNCTLAIDLEPGMLETGSPCLEELFGAEKEMLPRKCIPREAFESYKANNFSFQTTDFDTMHENLSNNAKQGGYFKRLRRLVCPSCWLYDGKGFTRHCLECGTRPDRCDGPVLEDEAQRCFDNHSHPPEPWEIHVLSVVGSYGSYGYGRYRNKAQVDVDKLKPKFDWMNQLQAPWRVIRPVSANNYYRVQFSYPMSKSARRSKRRVILMKATVKPSDEFVIVGYDEWCRMVGERQLLTWGRLHKHVSWTQNLTLRVKVALVDLLRSDMMSPFCWDFTFDTDTVAYVEPGGYMQSRVRHVLSSGKVLRWNLLNSLESERKKENEKLKQIAGDRGQFNFPGIERCLQDLRNLGPHGAQEKLRRKRRDTKHAHSSVDLPAPIC